MSEFDGIRDFSGWSAKLSALLGDAQAAAQRDEWTSRLNVCNRLVAFIGRSSPNTRAISALDEIADQAASALLRQTIEERLQAIAGRQADLAKLTKKVESTTESAQEAAASLRLDRAQKAIGALTDSILQLRGFRDLLQTGIDDPLATAVEKAIAAMQRLRKDIESRA